jgi:Complex I intermediate-associated protein 30 (CIA30)
MKASLRALLVSLLATMAQQGLAADEILLESFEQPSHHWFQMNDPVMGGKSTGTFKIQDGVGIFDGEVVDVPFLDAPGFIKVESRGMRPYADVSACKALKLALKSTVHYGGYRVSFGNAHPRGGKTFAFGYKANLKVPTRDDGEQFEEVEILFSDFSDLWDDATGDQIKSCKEYPQYCPTVESLQNMKTIAIWAEGVAGKVHLEIKSISAIGCANVASEADE